MLLLRYNRITEISEDIVKFNATLHKIDVSGNNLPAMHGPSVIYNNDKQEMETSIPSYDPHKLRKQKYLVLTPKVDTVSTSVANIWLCILLSIFGTVIILLVSFILIRRMRRKHLKQEYTITTKKQTNYDDSTDEVKLMPTNVV